MIEKGQRVSVEYTLKLDDGTVADTNVGQDPLTYTQGDEQILPALEREIASLGVDDAKQVTLSAEDGYGELDPEAFVSVESDRVPEEGREVGQILAVGDEPFQRKCIAKMKELRAAGQTLMVVSHDLELIKDICERGIVLEHGRVVHDAPIVEAVDFLRSSMSD